MLNLLLNRWSVVLALTFLMPVVAPAGTMAEYGLLLVIVNDPTSTHEVCLYNPGNTEESTFLEFDPSEPGAPSDRQEVIVGPGETECREFVALPNGALLKIDSVPGESQGIGGGANDFLVGGYGNEPPIRSACGELPAFLRKLAVQVFLKDMPAPAGRRTGGITLTDITLLKVVDTASP